MKIELIPDDLLFSVEERPVFAGFGRNGYIRVPGKKAIVHQSDGHVLGIVGRDYRLVTNQEAMEAARLCCRQVFPKTKPEEWKFSSAEGPATRSSCAIDLVHNSAALNFSVVEPGDKPEAYGPFIRVANSYNGRRALGFEIGFMRKVCQNGLILPDTIIRFHYSHSHRDIGSAIAFNIDSAKLARFQSGFSGMVDTLRTRPIGREHFAPIVWAVYDIHPPPKNQNRPRAGLNLRNRSKTSAGVMPTPSAKMPMPSSTRSPTWPLVRPLCPASAGPASPSSGVPVRGSPPSPMPAVTLDSSPRNTSKACKKPRPRTVRRREGIEGRLPNIKRSREWLTAFPHFPPCLRILFPLSGRQ